MKAGKRYPFLLLLGLVLLLMSACGTSGSGSTGNGNGPSSQTPKQVLQKSADTMKNLKLAHFDLSLDEMVNTTSASATPTTGSGTPQQLSLHVTGSGDEVLPDQSTAKIILGVARRLKQGVLLKLPLARSSIFRTARASGM